MPSASSRFTLPRFSRRIAIAGLIVAAFTSTERLAGQAAQAAASLGTREGQAPPDSLKKYRDRALEEVGRRKVHLDNVRQMREPLLATYATLLERVISIGTDIQGLTVAAPALEAKLREFDAAILATEAEGRRVLGDVLVEAERADVGTRASMEAKAGRMRAAGAGGAGWFPAPAFPHTMNPKVVFSVGAGFAAESPVTVGLELGTNLVGAVVGAALGGLGGGDDLKNYFSKNFAVGIALPLQKRHRIETGYSLGLGSVDFMKRSLWPVLAMLQIDSAGSDLPTEVRAADPTRATWSVPYVGVAFTFVTRDSLKAKMGRGVLVPIFTVAVRFPYYYPGNAASAFAAFFSDNNAKYVSANKAVLAFGVSIPLLRVDQ